MKQLLPFVLGFAACIPPTQVVSSQAVLGAEQSEFLVKAEPKPAALEVVSILTKRGFALADVDRDERGMTLHLRGDRRTVTEETNPNLDLAIDVLEALDTKHRGPYHQHALADITYGSAFYVRIEQRTPELSSVAIVGRVIRNGAELCTADKSIPMGPCVENEDVLSEYPGAIEAEVVHGVFAELELRELLVPRPGATHQSLASLEQKRDCEKYRAEQIDLAHRVTDKRASAAILGAMPTCQ